MSKFNASSIYKELNELHEPILTVLIIVVLVPLFLTFAFAKVTEGPIISSQSKGNNLNFTVGYAKTVDSDIEFYGKNTDKELPLSACEIGICFGISNDIRDFTLQSDSLVTGANECTDSWAVNVTTTLQIPADKESIISRITGRKNPTFLDAMRKSNNLVKYKPSTGLFAETELLPISIATETQIFDAFYKKEAHDFDKFSNNFKANADIAAIGSVIQDTFKNPYKKSIDTYSSKVSDQALSLVSGALNATTTIQGFTEKGDIDTGSLLDNMALKQSFNCQ